MKKSNMTISAPVFVNPNACDGCGLCTEVCPTQVFETKELTNKERKALSFFGRLKVRIKGNIKSHVARPDKCIVCGQCVRSCHEHAITVRNLKKSA